MSYWQFSTPDTWVAMQDQVYGDGGGVGPFLASYATDQENSVLLNGFIAADIKLDNRHSTGAGLICRADDLWSFSMMYVAPAKPNTDTTLLRLGTYRSGSLEPVVALKQEIQLDEDFNRFRLEFFSAQVRGSITTSARTYSLEYSMPYPPFPGCPGFVKFYGARLLARNISIGRLNAPFDRQTGGFDIFISYAKEDRSTVQAIVSSFRASGVSCWVDYEQVQLGDGITSKIEDGLQHSRFIVAIISRNLAQSSWCRSEYGPILARTFNRVTGKTVIPLRIDDCPDDQIPLLLYDINGAQYSDPSSFEKLIRFVQQT